MSNNKVVLVTGGSRGIGKSTAIEFARNGYDVVINYVNNDILANKLKEEIENDYKVNAIAIKCDVSNEQEVKEMIDEVISKFNKIDVLVNNAGIANDTIFEDKTAELFLQTLNVNLVGTFIVSKEVGKHMLNRKSGCIINVSSTNGIDTIYPESLDYDASKAGVISLTKNLALQYAPYIRVNALASGWVNTDMTKDLDLQFKQKEIDKILLNRFAEPSEIAKVIYFLSTDDASYINGSVIRVDGGNR